VSRLTASAVPEELCYVVGIDWWPNGGCPGQVDAVCTRALCSLILRQSSWCGPVRARTLPQTSPCASIRCQDIMYLMGRRCGAHGALQLQLQRGSRTGDQPCNTKPDQAQIDLAARSEPHSAHHIPM